MNIQHIFQGGCKVGGISFSAPVTSGSRVIMGASSSKREKTSVANTKFLNLYLQNSATSGDNRGMYLRLYMTGAGGGGEAARIFTTCENVACGTAHGAHISLNFGTTGSITGLGVAGRHTLHVPKAMTGGSYAVSMSEVWSDGAASDLAGATIASMHNYNNGGNGTGVTANDLALNLFSLTGFTVGDNNMIRTNTTTATHGLRINIGGVRYDILCSDSHA